MHVILQFFPPLPSPLIQFRHKDFLPRTPENYDYHCSMLDGPLAHEDSVTYGLNYRSPLNDLEYFHVADTQLPQDIMHVLLKGVVPYELRLMLVAFTTEKKYFTIDLLNERTRYHTYTQEEIRDKPSPIPNLNAHSTSLHQSGMIDCIKTSYVATFIVFWHLQLLRCGL